MFKMRHIGGNSLFKTKASAEMFDSFTMVMVDNQPTPLFLLPDDIQKQYKEARAEGLTISFHTKK